MSKDLFGKSRIKEAFENLQTMNAQVKDMNFMLSPQMANNIIREISGDITITFDPWNEAKYEDVNGHDLEKWNDTYKCKHCNKTPPMPPSVLEEDGEIRTKEQNQFYLYSCGYFMSKDCGE